MRARLTIAAHLDRLESQVRRVGERIGWPQAWLQEFISWSGDSRMTLEEFYVRFTLLRMETKPRFDAVKTEADARDFYTTSEYMLWRNIVHRRHSAWRRVLWTMKGKHGRLLELGCGTAPISAWVSRYKPGWRFGLYDIPDTPHLKYAAWRLRDRRECFGPWQVTTAIDVFEHHPNPLALAKRAVNGLAAGGYLHWNAVLNEQQNDLDLATPAQHAETVAYLNDVLQLVWQRDGYRVSRK